MTYDNNVLLIYTGGTIGMNHNRATGALEPFDFAHLLSKVPELEQFSTRIATYQFDPPIDSSNMSPRMWIELAHIIADNYDRYDGFVILHGTDTMAYTASALSYMLENLTKPVILTGSQLPIGQLRTDGKENLITGIEIASAKHPDGTAMVPEVGIYFNGHLMRGNRTTKQSADAFNAFESFNYPHLADAGVNITYREDAILRPDPNISQCMAGHVEMGRYGTGYQLKEAGVISGHDSTVESAVTKLMYLQATFDDTATVRRYMAEPIRGEMSV